MGWFTKRRMAVLGALLVASVAAGVWRSVVLGRRRERAATAALNQWALHKWDHASTLSGPE